MPIKHQTVSAETPCCHITRVCDADEDGQPDLDLSPCQDDSCTLHVCPNCVVRCANCGCTLCPDHAFPFDGEQWCRVCIAGSTDGCDDADWPCNDCDSPCPKGSDLCAKCGRLAMAEIEYQDNHPELRCPVRE